MRMLAGLLGARRAIEVGVFTGYSALCVALALPEDGELIACDVSEEWTAIARRYWEEAAVAGRIRLELAPAGETLDALVAEGPGRGDFDIAFIDAGQDGLRPLLRALPGTVAPRRPGADRQRALGRFSSRRERHFRGHPGAPLPQRKAPGRPAHRALHVAGGATASRSRGSSTENAACRSEGPVARRADSGPPLVCGRSPRRGGSSAGACRGGEPPRCRARNFANARPRARVVDFRHSREACPREGGGRESTRKQCATGSFVAAVTHLRQTSRSEAYSLRIRTLGSSLVACLEPHGYWNAHHPPRRHGRLLRVGGGARASGSRRSAGGGGRKPGGTGSGGSGQLRGPRVRGTKRDAGGAREAAVSPCGLHSIAHDPLRRSVG